MKKLLILFAAAGISIAAAKTYDITLSTRATIGHTELAPGEYRLRLETNKISLMDNKGKSVEADAKVESVDKKFDHTAILSKSVNGEDHIDEIQLGGSKTKLEFNK